MKTVRLMHVLFLVPLALHGAERSEVISKQFPAREGKVVVVEAGSLDVDVRISGIDDVRVEVELACAGLKEKAVEAWLTANQPTFEDNDSRLSIAVRGNTPAFLQGLIIVKARMHLVVPPYVRLDLSTSGGNLSVEGDLTSSGPMRLFATSGDLEFFGYAEEVEARTTSGDIRLRFSKPVNSLLVRTSSGDGEIVGGVRLFRGDSSSGTLRAVGLLGSAGVATTSGDVSLYFDALPNDAEVKVTTTSGKVRLTFPHGTQPQGEVQSTSGEIRSAYSGETPGVGGRLVLRGSGPKIVISTRSGRVELH